MKKSVVLSVVIAVLSMILIINCAPVEQQTAAITQSQIRAVKGDTVWVIINYVKADKQEDYERFHNDYFYPIIDEITDQDEKKQIDCIRVLHPLALGSSGNYTY
ncbi:MAG: hypothetical protein GY863_02960, partial [bacterium]|nr:hypothetical protein [bacterium]